jgi:hypothetical protein
VKTNKATTTRAKKKRIRIAIVGSDSVTSTQALDSAEYLLPKLLKKYDITRIVTVKEDLLGRAFRKVAKRLELDIKTFSAADHGDQSTALELATASLLWEAKRFIVVVGSGKIKGCAYHAMQMLDRHKNKKVKILELED